MPDRRPVLTPADQLSSEAAKQRAARRGHLKAREREVLGMARLALVQLADELGDAPTDLPHSGAVKEEYEAAFAALRADDWPQAREHLSKLGLAALGWCARIDLAEMRESGEFAGTRFCEACHLPIVLSGPGRPPKRCDDCREAA